MEDDKDDNYYSFQLSDGLLYHEQGGVQHLYILKKLQREVFKLAHNNISHPDGQRMYKHLLINFFLPHMKTDLMKYIYSYPACMKSKPP